jgi:hypothetical protein
MQLLLQNQRSKNSMQQTICEPGVHQPKWGDGERKNRTTYFPSLATMHNESFDHLYVRSSREHWLHESGKHFDMG